MARMMNLLFRLSIAVLVAAPAAYSSTAKAETLIVQGSSTFNRQIMEKYQGAIEAGSGHELTVIPNRTMLGLIAVMEGRAHLGMISAPLKNDVLTLRKAMPGLSYDRLQAHEIKTTRIAIGVHPSNPVRKASTDTMAKVLKGEIADWAQLGGRPGPIRLVLVGGGGGVAGTVQAELLGGQAISASNVLYVKTALQLVQVVEQEPNSMGIGQLSLIKQRAIPEVVTEKPIEQPLSFVTLGDPTPAMQSVIDAARHVAEKYM
jgi:ABC-type phosphate transport system substrate-binding protein